MYLAIINNISTRNMCTTEPLEAQGGGGGEADKISGMEEGENWNAVCKLN